MRGGHDHPRITADPKIMMGKPVIEGTRVAVGFLFRMLGNGCPVDDVIAEYDLSREDILAAQNAQGEAV